MSSKLISGDKAASAQRLVWHGPKGGPPGQETPEESLPGGAQRREDNDQARVLIAQQGRIQELERELESRPRQAYQRGFNEGQAAGIEQTNKRLDPVLAKFAKSIQDLTGVRKRHLLEAEQDAVKLAMAVARKILHRELSVDPEALLGVVKAAFERVEARDVHRIRLHPEDTPTLERHLVAIGMPPRVELVPDTSLERGSVIVETNRGSLDASVSSQIREIERGLVDLVRRSS
jgi:flagellar assembly protein FliH